MKRNPRDPQRVTGKAQLVHRPGHTGDTVFGCAEPGLTACGSQPGFSIPRSLPRGSAGWGEIPQLPPRIHFCDKPEMKGIRCVVATTHRNAGTTMRWEENNFSPKNLVFPFFFWFVSLCQIFPSKGLFKHSIFCREQTASPPLSKKK